MRKFLLFALFLVSAVSFSQAPQFLNYQAIARDASGVIVTTPIGIKFEILQGSTVVYEEVNTITPSSAGVFTTAIGSGSPVFGTFSAINWANGSYFIRVGIDPTGGTSYSTVGTSQLLSVPYALYAESTKPSTLSISGNSLSISNGNSVTLPAGTTYTAGTGISISGGTITNTAPATTLTPAGIATISGANPSFTIDVPPPSINYNTGTQELTLTQGTVVTTATITTTSTSVNISGSGVSGSYPNYTITPTPATSVTSTGTSILVNGTSPSYTIVPQPSLTVTGNQLSIADGNTVTLPTGTTYTNGAGIAFTSGTVITNTAMDQTVVISNGINTNVSGTYPFFTIDATPSLSIGSGSISISGGNAVALPTAPPPTTVVAGTNVSVGGTGPTYTIDATPTLSIGSGSISISGGNSVALPTAPPPTTVIAGTNVSVGGTGPTYTVNATPSLSIGSGSISISGGNSVALPTAPPPTTVIAGTNVTVGGTGPTYTVNATPSLSISGNTLSITGGTSVTLPIPAPLTPSTGISITSGTITNTAPDVPVTLLGAGATTIGGTYPNFTIGTPAPAPVVITGQGTASITTAGTNFTVTTPPVNMTYTPATGILSYSPSAASSTINISPTLSFAGSTLTVGSNSVVVPGTNLWARSSTTATTLSNTNDFVGIGSTNPRQNLQVESATGSSSVSVISLSTGSSQLSFGTAANHALGRIEYNNTSNFMSFGTNGGSGFIGIDAAGRFGVGTTSPSEMLQVQNSGNTDVSILSPGGSFASLAFGFTGNHFMGRLRYDITNNSLDFWTNGSGNRMFINSSGLVAIGHSTPSYQLDVQSSGSASLLRLANASGNVKIDAFPGATNELQIGSTGTGMSFVTSTFLRMKIDNNGNVGIGGINPLARLDIFGGMTYFRPNSGNPNAILVQDYIGTSMRMYTDALAGTPYDLTIGTYPNGHIDQLFLKQSNGFVGIGTTNPTSKLHVNGSVAITDGSQGAGKVLTSDAAGKGTWQTATAPSHVRSVVVDPNDVDLSYASGSVSKTTIGGWLRPCLSLPDGSLTQFQSNIPIPSDWNGTSSFTIELLYSSPSTTGNFYVTIGNSNVGLNVNAGSPTSSTSFAAPPSSTTEGLMELSHIMFTSATDRMIQIYIRRDGGNASDTSTQPMRVYGFRLKYMD